MPGELAGWGGCILASPAVEVQDGGTHDGRVVQGVLQVARPGGGGHVREASALRSR